MDTNSQIYSHLTSHLSMMHSFLIRPDPLRRKNMLLFRERHYKHIYEDCDPTKVGSIAICLYR